MIVGVTSDPFPRHGPARLLAGALAAATLAAMSGCATTAVTLGNPDATSSSPVVPRASQSLVASGSADPGGDDDFVETDDSDVAATPTFTDAERSDQVRRTTQEFLEVSLTRGYPDKDDRTFLRDSQQLMTSKGFAAQKRRDAEQGGARAAADLYSRHLRRHADVTTVRPTILAGDRATARVEYRLVTQRVEGGRWRTVATGQGQKQVLSLVHRPGSGWLVSSVS